MKRITAIAVVAASLVASSYFFAAPAFSQETELSAQEANDVCTRPVTDWVNFCNGIVQAAATRSRI
jgi:hypothetical protein